MAYKSLFLFLEGADDERFFRAVLFPLFRKRYEEVRAVQVSQMTKKRVSDWLRSVEGMRADYLFVRDLDRHPCATAAKDAFRDVHPRLDPARIQVVKVEIESWYCAGIGSGRLTELSVATCADAEEITKERLESVLPGGRELRIPTMIEILESYDLDRAAQRNGSLRYFLRKHLGLAG